MPLYFAAERPVVERDGTLIMVDDDRMPLEPGETPELRKRALPHARLLPADRRGRERRRHARRRSSRRCCSTRTSERQGRVIDHDAVGVDGEEEAGGVLLMAHVDLIATTSSVPRRARAQEPAALHHLRQRRRRQAHADRPAAVRVEADLRGPAGRAGGRLAKRRHAGRRARLRAAASTAWPPSASRASRSTSPTGSSRPSSASSSSPTRPATSSTRATWSPARRPPTAP